MAEDRTEQPTARRLQEARKRGQVARTKEAGQAASLIAATIALGWMGSSIMTRLSEMLAVGLERAGHASSAIAPGDITKLSAEGLSTVGITVGPIALTSVITALAFHGAQGGWVFAPEALHMNWGRLNPANGFKRFSPSNGGIELLRAAIATTVIGVLGWNVVQAFLPAATDLARMTPLTAASEMWSACARLIKQTTVGLLVLAGADYLVQRHLLHKSLRMTKQEIRDEHRLTEGNPEIKSRVRKIQREMMRRRMLSATKRATVVITNPTHYAVALDYQRGMAAPVVIAKGQDHLAIRIKAIAAEHGIPMVENVTLARALYGSAEVGEIIPGPLFEAVAEVLAYLIRIKRLIL